MYWPNSGSTVADSATLVIFTAVNSFSSSAATWLAASLIDSNVTSKREAYRLERASCQAEPLERVPWIVQLTVERPAAIRSKTRSRLARSCCATTSGRKSLTVTQLVAERSTVPERTFDVTGTWPRGPAPRRARRPTSRSWSTAPAIPPTVPILNEPNVSSFTTAMALTWWALIVLGPVKIIGWPNARAVLLPTAVVVPMAANVRSP